MSRFSRGDNPSSQALRACTISASAPAAFTFSAKASSDCSGSWSSMPMRHFTVTGMLTADFIAATQVADQIGLGHQAGAEAAFLHAVGRAADIEIDFAIAEILADARAFRELARIGAAELQRHRMLERIEAKQALAVAMDHRAGRDHLGIEHAPCASAADGRTGNAGPSIPSWARRKMFGPYQSSSHYRTRPSLARVIATRIFRPAVQPDETPAPSRRAADRRIAPSPSVSATCKGCAD